MGQGSEQLSEELAATIRRDYRLNAYVFNRATEERRKEQERVAEQRRRQIEALRAQGITENVKIPSKTVRIEDQFAVLVGGYKDIESARKALDAIRKLPPPPEKLQHKAYRIGPTAEPGKGLVETAPLNPFATAFVVHNPTVPMSKNTEPAKLENLKEYNADEPYSLLKCGKPWTLMVMMYQGGVKLQGQVAGESSFLDKLGFGGNKPGELLNASAKQAHGLAEVLRKSKFDAYVLHVEHCSYVCVGGFDAADDPRMQAMQRAFTEATTPQIRDLKALKQLLSQPLPMPVPTP